MAKAKIIVSKNFITVWAPYAGERHYELWMKHKDREVTTWRYEDGQLISVSIELPDAFKDFTLEVEDY
jgi:hypothetical protein